MTEPEGGCFTGNAAAAAAALSKYGLDGAQLEKLARILAVLEQDERAPTTIREPHEAAERHLADSLSALGVDVMREAREIADLGAGAGFPGLPLAVALPTARVRLVESQRRKCDFIEHLLAEVEIENASVVCARAEEWAEGREANDVICARALAPQPVVLEYAAPLLRAGGALVDWRGRRHPEEEQAAQRAGAALGLSPREIRAVEPFPGATGLHLHVWEKTNETPASFPRRAGIARKRPLGI